MSIQDNLLNDFPQHSSKEWKEKMMKDLRINSDEDLSHIDYNGLKHEPFYTNEHLSEDTDLIKSIQNAQKASLDWSILDEHPRIKDTCMDRLNSSNEENIAKENHFEVDGLHYKHLAANVVNEMLAILQHLMTHLEDASRQKLNLKELVSNSTIYVGTGLSYFSEVAKYRGLRFLCAQILQQYEISEMPKFSAIVGQFYYSHLDTHTNLLRATTMGMSAIIGGVDDLYITPYDFPLQSEKGKRWAANVQKILKHESHFANVLDPSAGSYYVEGLTVQLVKSVWSKLQSIEEKGGMFALNKKGEWWSIFEDDFTQLIQAYQSNAKTMIGVNKYMNDQGIHVHENKSSISNSIQS